MARFKDLDEPALREIVLGVLGVELTDFYPGVLLENLFPTDDDRSPRPTRQRTGRLAEEAFADWHAATGRPIAGQLQDMRDQACGYDYRVDGEDVYLLVEVKGVADGSGSVSFTDLEWRVAQDAEDNYVLAVVTDPERNPTVRLFSNPAASFRPRRQFNLTVQVSYHVAASDLRGAL